MGISKDGKTVLPQVDAVMTSDCCDSVQLGDWKWWGHIVVLLLQVSQGSQSSQVRAYTLDSITNVAVYLRDHALHSCQVFDHASQLTDDTAKPAQVSYCWC